MMEQLSFITAEMEATAQPPENKSPYLLVAYYSLGKYWKPHGLYDSVEDAQAKKLSRVWTHRLVYRLPPPDAFLEDKA